MPHLGFSELIVVFLIIIVLFGATRLPQIGRGLGEGIRNFKKGLKTDEDGPEQLEEKTGTPRT
ncbi:MAG TPA: twin-arginine translocase TatA/TatE family subunit [Thermoanaerobaculia bacterium]|jgi:sec-independent protein translocase protein TatA|nr:twin-arginine translocase TatA/TatE family subunit [Thermoanaerobaculia bacterium]